MKLVGRLKAENALRTLRSRPGPSDPQWMDARRRLIGLGSAAVPPLLDALAAHDLRAAAREILGELLDDRTLPEFLRVLGSADGAQAGCVVDILGRGRSYEATRLLDVFADPSVPKSRLEAILSAQMGRIHPKVLIGRLPALTKEPRAIVFRLLDRHATADAVLESIRLVDDPDWWIRRQMARLLGRVRHPLGTEALIRLLKDENRGVRLEATRALALIKDPLAIPALSETLRDVDLRVQTGAIDALLAIGDVAAVPHLVQILKDESETARRGAVEVLNEVATVEAIKDLVLALRDADWWVRARAADALGSLGGDKVVEAVIDVLSDGDEAVRRCAVEILNMVSDARAVEPLIRALDDGDWWVRERAIDALARTGDPRAFDALADLLQRDPSTTLLCVRALGELGDPRAVSIFSRLRHAEGEEIRRAAIAGLTGLLHRGLSGEERIEVQALLREAGVETVRQAVAKPREVRLQGALDPTASVSGPPRSSGARPSPRDATDLPEGELLAERYRVLRKIGGGGFGTVYLVEDILIQDELILKVLSPHLTHDETMIQRFIREMRVARRITHPGVIRIHELVDLSGLHGITMEYFPSRDLAQLLKSSGPLSVERGIPIMIRVAEALAAAHERGTIHRDIKPANILVGADDEVKVVDFGLAIVGQSSGSRLTRSGVLIGTPEYMAPEQITEGRVDARGDIYSLGVVMYEAFSGVAPFAGEITANVLFRHIEGDIPTLRQANPAVPEELEAVVMEALARNPGERPASAAELARRLRDVYRTGQAGAEAA